MDKHMRHRGDIDLSLAETLLLDPERWSFWMQTVLSCTRQICRLDWPNPWSWSHCLSNGTISLVTNCKQHGVMRYAYRHASDLMSQSSGNCRDWKKTMERGKHTMLGNRSYKGRYLPSDDSQLCNIIYFLIVMKLTWCSSITYISRTRSRNYDADWTPHVAVETDDQAWPRIT